MEKAPNESVIAIQAETGFPENELPDPANWDIRKYGRNLLMFWVKDIDNAKADEVENKSSEIRLEG